MENNLTYPEHRTKPPVLDERLSAAVSFVRNGAVAADIGTDHAYIPVYLVMQGICKRCVASDINSGPVEKARGNIEKYGLSDKIELIQTDGLNGIENTGAEDIIICGMGGDLISDIISQADFVFDEKISLILQPMSKVEKLRKYLADTGFLIEDEQIMKSDGKIYQCIQASWSGTPYTLSQAELLLGSYNIQRGETGNGVYTELLENAADAAERRLKGRISGGLNTEKESQLLSELNEIMKKGLQR